LFLFVGLESFTRGPGVKVEKRENSASQDKHEQACEGGPLE
jgi:hypothetical protein